MQLLASEVSADCFTHTSRTLFFLLCVTSFDMLLCSLGYWRLQCSMVTGRSASKQHYNSPNSYAVHQVAPRPYLFHPICHSVALSMLVKHGYFTGGDAPIQLGLPAQHHLGHCTAGLSRPRDWTGIELGGGTTKQLHLDDYMWFVPRSGNKL